MTARNTESETSCGKILRPCSFLISYLNTGHQIHPIDPVGPKYSEFLVLNNKKTFRILHLAPEVRNNIERSILNECGVEKRTSVSRLSLTEEYWFTRWNKPLQVGVCNCSFRRSQQSSNFDRLLPSSARSSKRSFYNGSIVLKDLNRGSFSSYVVPAIKIINVETFVERLIQDTFFEALQEYLMKKNIVLGVGGIDNFGFNQSSEELSSVILRRKCYRNLNGVTVEEGTDFNQSNSVQNIKNVPTTTTTIKDACSHKAEDIKHRPLVILLHGIGSTADIWWNIINKLLYRGYEIIAPDMLGHGYSSAPNHPNSYKFKNLLNDLLQVFDHYTRTNENRKAIIIGHSFGCSLATAVARLRTQQVVQLILISGGGPTPLASPAQTNELSILSCLRTLLSPLIFCGMKRSFFYSSRGKHFNPCELHNGIPEYVLKYIRDGQNWPEGDAAFHRKILIPTLLVHGLQDTNVTLVQECEMERTIPRAFLELIPNAGHLSMVEAPEHLGHMILCFMDWWSR